MKINLDDPNLTAFALGELSGSERTAMEQAIASSPEAQQFVAETQQFSRLLKSEYAADLHAPPTRSLRIIAMEEQRRLWSPIQWGSLAAVLVIFAVLGGVALTAILRQQGTIAQQSPGKPIGLPKRSFPDAVVETEQSPADQTYASQPATAAPSPEMVLGVERAEFTEAAPAAPPPAGIASIGETAASRYTSAMMTASARRG